MGPSLSRSRDRDRPPTQFSVPHQGAAPIAGGHRDAGVSPQRLRQRNHMNTALLVIDEVGSEPMTRHEASLFIRLVSYR